MIQSLPLFGTMHRVKVHYYFDRDSDTEVYSPFSEHSGDPSDDELALNMVVGGLYYSLSKSVIKKLPDCYFAKALTDKGDASEPLTIDRDGKLFKHIQNYLNFRSANYRLRSIGWVVSIREEAYHYNLPGLVKICNKEIRAKLFRWGIYTLPSLNVLEPLNDGNEVKRVLLSHVHHSSVTGNVDVSHISGSFYTTLVKHKIQASSIVKRRDYHENCPEFFLKTSAASKPDLSESDYSAVLAIMDNIPLLPNVFMCVDSPVVIRVSPGTSIDEIEIPEGCVSQMGCAYCILQAAEAGGAITVTQDGITHTLTKAGECVLFLQDGAFEMEPVTSGALVVLYCVVHRGARYNFDRPDPNTTTAAVPAYIPPVVSTTVCDLLVAALRQDLTRYNSVVVPFTRLYNFASVDLDNLCLVTDPASLIRQDAQLYEYLGAHFDVTVVTVCYHLVGGVHRACVLGPVPASLPMGPVYTVPALPTAETTATISASSTTSATASNTAGVLIVSAARGYGKYGKVFSGYRRESAGVSFVAGLQISAKAII